jgi:FkbM family methyltransferase
MSPDGAFPLLAFRWRAWRYRLRVEPAEVRYVIGSLRPGDCAVDIGAHRGGYLYWMQRQVTGTGRVLAFEPQAQLAAYLKDVKERLGLSQVTVERMALSDRAGEAVLHVPSGGPACGATLEEDLVQGKDDVQTVPVCTLDEYLQRAGGLRPRLIKCDAEGHELRIFHGATRTLDEARPRLVFECEARHHPHGSIAAVFEYLEQRGYCGHFRHLGAMHEIAEFTPALQADPDRGYVNNFIFHPREESCPS